MKLQRNKVKSLLTACPLIDSLIIAPGEVFSFWRVIGKPASRRGFPPGLQLSFGSLVSMDGGGLCQLSNLLYWVFLHSPLTVIERHRHATDPFPDFRRTVPFGSGATVFYNYLDLAVENKTTHTFQICVSMESEYLFGELRCDSQLPVVYSVIERNHMYVRSEDAVFRENELWRQKTDSVSGRLLKEELIMKNSCRVLYDVPDDLIRSSVNEALN